MKKILIFVFLLLLSSCGSKFEKGLVEYNKNDVEKAVTICEGDDGYGCSFIRGMAYVYGRGYERDVRKGIKLVKESSDKGIVQAQSELGVFYLKGYGVPQNYSLGMKLVKMAAEKGNTLALYNLGIIYRIGGIEKKDLDLSIEYSIKAFEEGRADGALIAGKAFYEKEDYDSAVKWFKKGSRSGSVECEYTLGLFYEEVKHRDFKKAYKWFMSAAKKGLDKALNKVGIYNYYGYGRPVNVNESIKWFIKAAEKNHMDAQYSLGYIYQSKDYKKYDKALYWYRKAEKNGKIQAITKIGLLYLDGHGVKKDEKKALEFFAEAIKKGDIGASYIMGRAHELGVGTEKNMNKAVENFEFAADNGHEGAIKKLARINIESGKCDKAIEIYLKASKYGVSFITEAGLLYYFEKKCLNKKKAVPLIMEAAKKGDPRAQEYLSAFYFDGKVIEKDMIEAYAWVNIALSKTRRNSGIALRNKIERRISLEEVRIAQRRSQELIRKYGLNN